MITTTDIKLAVAYGAIIAVASLIIKSVSRKIEKNAK